MRDHVDAWIAILAPLLSPAFPAEPLEALRPMAPHLRSEFGKAAFTPDSARSVAAAERFGPVPAWDVMVKTLRAYVRESRPITYGQLPSPVEPDREPRSLAEIQRVGDMLAQHRQELREAAVVVAEGGKPLPNVQLSGERLAKARRMHAGISEPVGERV